ncbi:MAG TPA: hypothetical protein VH595_13990 [Verrucomicrobiae bacterium]|jgi:hypothetical protein|nr:hypothetical protein [Verrucomicrobiae bacterium]
MEHRFENEQLPSGKQINRHFGEDGFLVYEQHTYGMLDIGIKFDFKAGVKVDETYFSKRRLVSRRSYEKARIAYPDMPSADNAIEDWGRSLLQGVRKQKRQDKAEAERRLAESAESQFPRPASTNWLRVIAREKSHLVIFASRDWKVLSRERTIATGREWLDLFGFRGSGDGNIAKGLEVGFEVVGDRKTMLNASQLVLTDVNAFVANPLETTRWSDSIRLRPRPRKMPELAWPTVLPPLIEFLSDLPDVTVKIFNHHQ